MTPALPGVVERFVAAVNAGDLDAVAATFAEDAYVLTQAKAHGPEAVRALLAKEFIDDRVTLEVFEAVSHHGDVVAQTKYDGNYDKTNLPDPLVMTNYFALRGEKIVSLAVVFIPPAPAAADEEAA